MEDAIVNFIIHVIRGCNSELQILCHKEGEPPINIVFLCVNVSVCMLDRCYCRTIFVFISNLKGYANGNHDLSYDWNQ